MKKRSFVIASVAFAALLAAGGAQAAEKLRLLTWADYAPKEVVDAFTKETGIEGRVSEVVEI